MEQEHSSAQKVLLAVVVIILLSGIGYLLSTQYSGTDDVVSDNTSTVVTVENTPMVGGVVVVPEGFPQDIPIESENILESATTSYPDQDFTQLSLSYITSKTVEEKYAEYIEFMQADGFEVTEGDEGAPVRAIFGTGEGENLSVLFSDYGDVTLVQLSYLIK